MSFESFGHSPSLVLNPVPSKNETGQVDVPGILPGDVLKVLDRVREEYFQWGRVLRGAFDSTLVGSSDDAFVSLSQKSNVYFISKFVVANDVFSPAEHELQAEALIVPPSEESGTYQAPGLEATNQDLRNLRNSLGW